MTRERGEADGLPERLPGQDAPPKQAFADVAAGVARELDAGPHARRGYAPWRRPRPVCLQHLGEAFAQGGGGWLVFAGRGDSDVKPATVAIVVSALFNNSDRSPMLVVTHEMGFAREVADQMVFMDDGIVVESGPPREVLANPQRERTKAFLSKVL